MHTQDSPSSANSQAFFRASIYMRAMSCARFSPIEQAIVYLVFEMGWVCPRFVRGQVKASPVELSASRLAPMLGFARQKIQEAMRRLRAGGVLNVDERGLWLLNPRWQDWMDENGMLRIKATCYPYIQEGFPGMHDCDAPLPTDLDPARGQVEAAREVGSAQFDDTDGVAPVSPTGDTPCHRSVTPPVTEWGQVEAPNGDNQSQPIEYSRVAAMSPIGDTEPAPLSPIGDTLARAPIGNAPAPRAITERAPASDYDSSKREVKGSHDIYIKREHLTTVDIKPDDADYDIFRRDDASFPGDVVPDPETFRRVHALVLARYPMNDSIQQGIYKCRFQYETAWVLKAVKRAALLKPRCANFGYVNAILVGWLRGGGTDEGPEDRFDDELNPIPVPVVKFPTAGPVPVDMDAARRKFQEMHKQLYGDMS